MRPLWPFKRKPELVGFEPRFTGNCMVWQTDGDGRSVGRCWHSTYDGRCHLHGDVSTYLGNLPEWAGWPSDYDLPRP